MKICERAPKFLAKFPKLVSPAHEGYFAIRRLTSSFSVGNLEKADEKCVLSVADDGIGFPQEPEVKLKSLGVRIMNYRARTIGASLEIKPVSKSGTIVTCALPVEDGPKVSRRNIGPGDLAIGGG